MSRTSNRHIHQNTSVATQRPKPITRRRRARPRPSTRTLARSCYPRCQRRRWSGCRAWTHVAPTSQRDTHSATLHQSSGPQASEPQGSWTCSPCWPWRTLPFRTTCHSRPCTWHGDGFSIPWPASEAWSPPCEWRWTEHPSTSTCPMAGETASPCHVHFWQRELVARVTFATNHFRINNWSAHWGWHFWDGNLWSPSANNWKTRRRIRVRPNSLATYVGVGQQYLDDGNLPLHDCRDVDHIVDELHLRHFNRFLHPLDSGSLKLHDRRNRRPPYQKLHLRKLNCVLYFTVQHDWRVDTSSMSYICDTFTVLCAFWIVGTCRRVTTGTSTTRWRKWTCCISTVFCTVRRETFEMLPLSANWYGGGRHADGVRAEVRRGRNPRARGTPSGAGRYCPWRWPQGAKCSTEDNHQPFMRSRPCQQGKDWQHCSVWARSWTAKQEQTRDSAAMPPTSPIRHRTDPDETVVGIRQGRSDLGQSCEHGARRERGEPAT